MKQTEDELLVELQNTKDELAAAYHFVEESWNDKRKILKLVKEILEILEVKDDDEE